MTEETSVPASPTMPRPGSMMVCGADRAEGLRARWRSMASPYAETGRQPSSYAAGKPPPRSSSRGCSPRRAQQVEDAGRGGDRVGPRLGVALLGADVEGDAGGVEPELVGEGEHRRRPRTVEQPYLRDSGQSDPSPEVTSRQSTSLPGCGLGDLVRLVEGVDDEQPDPERRRLDDVVPALDRVGVDERAGRGAGAQRGPHLGRAGHVEAATDAARAASRRGCGLAFTA